MASPGRCPPPPAEHRVWPPAPESLGGHRGNILGERAFGANQPSPAGAPLSTKPLSAPFTVTPRLSLRAECTGRPLSTQ